MPRPPLANLFAAHDADPTALNEMMRDLQHSGEFAEVWRPVPSWVVAVAPLPGSSPDDVLAREHQLAFAEGRDVVLAGAGDPEARLREIVELADLHPERLASLPGDFGFIRFRANGEATVVRSCGGLVPFYLKLSGNRWAIGTRLEYFVRYLPDEPELDALSNALWAASWPTFADGRTPLKGVKILARGSFAKINKTKVGIDRYWNPRPERIHYPTESEADEHARRLREVLLAELQRDLDPRGGISSL